MQVEDGAIAVDAVVQQTQEKLEQKVCKRAGQVENVAICRVWYDNIYDMICHKTKIIMRIYNKFNLRIIYF